MGEFDIDVAACRGRQQRLVAEMARLDVPLVIVTQAESVQWLTGARLGPLFQPAAALTVAGCATLVIPGRKGRPLVDEFAADTVVGYEAQWHSTLRNDQREASSAQLIDALREQGVPNRIGVEYSSFGPHLSQSVKADGVNAELIDVEPTIYRLRRRKDADELRLMKKAIAATRAMYERAREIIRPGINELEVYSQLHAVAVHEFGEPVTYFGQDFQANSRGGPPRDRTAQAGELYILDLGAGFRGYFSDNARTIAVDGSPTEDQLRAWQQIVKIFELIDSRVKPGISCKTIFQEAQSILDECRPWQFDHHLGHGVGLYPHEAPHLNPHWNDEFAAGDLFTVEPGLYDDALRGGIRLEHNYLVTGTGVELLTDFPLELSS